MQVIGFDISQKAIEIQRKYGIEAKLIKNKSYLKQKKFNYLILLEVLEHLTNPEKLVSELKDSSNFFIVSIPNLAYFAYRLKLFFRGRISMQWMYPPSEHLRFWSHIEFIEWMEVLGFKLVKFKCVEGILSSIDFLPNLLSWNIVYLFKCQGK